MSQNTFKKFLDFTPSQREVSLAIAQDKKELEQFQKILDKQGFKQAKTIAGLISETGDASENYYICKDGVDKETYDFLVQYPTGQIEFFGKDKMKSKIVFPCYNNSAAVFLIDKKNLLKSQKQGFNILNHAGLAYQN
jgi:hypothetical protein